MPNHLSLKTAIEKNRIESDVPFLTLVEIDVIEHETGAFIQTLRFVRDDDDLHYQGETYKKAIFSMSVAEASKEMPQISLNLVDPTGSVLTIIDQHRGGVGWPCRLKHISAGDLDQPPEVEHLIYVLGSSAENYAIEFQMGAANPVAQRFPRRIQRRDKCSWIFKSKECGYTGTKTSCDYSMTGDNGCATHGNVKNFGGFPGIQLR